MLTYMAKLAEITDKRIKGDMRRVRARLNKNSIFIGILVLDGTANAKNPHALKLKASQRQRSESPRYKSFRPRTRRKIIMT